MTLLKKCGALFGTPRQYNWRMRQMGKILIWHIWRSVRVALEVSQMQIDRGTRLVVRTATEPQLPVRALGPAEQGHSFRVVWVCREVEWNRALSEGRQPIAAPIPEADVLRVDEG